MSIRPEDYSSVYQFLKSTGENNLKHMLVDSKFNETYFRMLVKIVRSCKEEEFIQLATQGGFPKIKFTGPEIASKEKFWEACHNSWVQAGLATTAKAA